MQQISARSLADWLADSQRPQPLLLDVREPWEVALCAIPGATPMPMASVPLRLGELPEDRDIVVICHHGGRSMQVAMFLNSRGFEAVHNLTGGVHAWAHDVDPAMPKY
ncbi:MAG TPA: rhodanese-like domain-containing protein [Azospira sp.]|nr:rhodanese-like domain-containing protein [Azospira sp.]